MLTSEKPSLNIKQILLIYVWKQIKFISFSKQKYSEWLMNQWELFLRRKQIFGELKHNKMVIIWPHKQHLVQIKLKRAHFVAKQI